MSLILWMTVLSGTFIAIFADNRKCKMPLQILDNSLLVEGKEDYCIITLFCKILQNRLANIFIYYGEGAGNLFLPVKCAICYEKTYLVLLDNDNGGDNGLKNLIKNILKDILQEFY